jgi:uncharacterized protein (DUF362 family)
MKISRRRFLTYSGLAAAWAATGGLPSITSLPELHWDAVPDDGSPAPLPVAIAHGEDYAALLERAIGRLGGARLIAAPGERVVVKPTLAWNRPPGSGANVEPALLQSVLTLALAAGAAEVIVFDRTVCRADLAYRTSGAAPIVERLGDARVRLVHLAETDFIPIAEAARDRLPADAPIGAYRACRFLLEADRVINLAAMRHHPTRRVALGMANLLGLVGGDVADPAWAQRMDAELAVLVAVVRPELTILDATNVVVRNGPLGGGDCDLARHDTLLVGRDPVAVEAAGSRIFAAAAGLKDELDLPHIALAERLGAGRASLTGRVIDLDSGSQGPEARGRRA